MNHRFNVKMKITMATNTALARLRANREDHERIYQEALKGWATALEEVLTRRHTRLQETGTCSTDFSKYRKPTHFLSVYDTVIEMLDLHTGDEIELTAAEVKQFCQDQWEWANAWLVSNSHYSGRAAQKLSE